MNFPRLRHPHPHCMSSQPARHAMLRALLTSPTPQNPVHRPSVLAPAFIINPFVFCIEVSFQYLSRHPCQWPPISNSLLLSDQTLPEVSSGSKQLVDSFADHIVVGLKAVSLVAPYSRLPSTQRQCDLRTNLPVVSIHRRLQANEVHPR